MTKTDPRTDYQKHLWREIRNERGRVIAYEAPRGGVGVEVMLSRPPFRSLCRYAHLAGRGRRRSQSPQAVADRCALVAEAWRLRTNHGMTIREIAARVDRSPSLVGRWLHSVPAFGGGWLDDIEYRLWSLTQRSERQREIAGRP